MKQLSNYINEWKINGKSIENIDKEDFSKCFIYELDKEDYIHVFGYYEGTYWKPYDKYRNNVYINGKHEELDDACETEKLFPPGQYKVYIKGINEVTTCNDMFLCCEQLVSVPLFETNNVKDFNNMFNGCSKLKHVPKLNLSSARLTYWMFGDCLALESVPKFDLHNCEDISSMFANCENLKDVPLFTLKDNIYSMYCLFSGCSNLSEKTKEDWSNVYNFNSQDKR